MTSDTLTLTLNPNPNLSTSEPRDQAMTSHPTGQLGGSKGVSGVKNLKVVRLDTPDTIFTQGIRKSRH